MKKIWITGARGQLGQELKPLFNQPELETHFTTTADVDITNERQVAEFWQRHGFDFCINTAAFTAVDKAETEKEAAFLVNSEAVGFLAKAAKQAGGKLIQLSTDYVFDGLTVWPRKPDDATRPINVYGESKLKGEQLALLAAPNSLIIRTSWLYGLRGKNFVKTMLSLARSQPEVKVVFDQVGAPTSAYDLATCIVRIVVEPADFCGTYHYCNQGVASWFDFAKAIFEMSNLNPKVYPILSSQFPTLAKRPAYSVMDCSKTERDFGLEIPYWRDSLRLYLHKLNSEAESKN